MRMRALAALATLMALTAASCGIDEYYTGMGQGALPGDPLYKAPDVYVAGGCGLADAPTAPMTTPDLAGATFRFDSLALTKPLPDSLSAMVNPVIQDQMDQGIINVLLIVDRDDRNAQEMTFRLGAAEKVDETYRLTGEPAPTEAKMLDGRFDFTGVAEVVISVDLGTEKLLLPVKEVELSAILAPDGTQIGPGLLIGALTEADAETVVILGSTLKDFLTGSDPKILPDLDLDEDGVNDAWQFEGCFTATPVTLAP
jgi:hypothetical protein